MNNLMLDLETLGTGPDAAIVAIGAVAFDPLGSIGKKLYLRVDLDSAINRGGTVTGATYRWWLQQSDAARLELTRNDNVHIVDALDRFRVFCLGLGDLEQLRVWGNGAAFDNVILRSAYQRAHVSEPWKWWNDRCYRTLRELAPSVPYDQIGTAHCAVDDAESQALHLIEIIRGTRRGNS